MIGRSPGEAMFKVARCVFECSGSLEIRRGILQINILPTSPELSKTVTGAPPDS